MRITEKSTLQQVAAVLAGALRGAGIRAVLTGGACATIYSAGGYQSEDLDLILQSSPTQRSLDEAMAKAGFARNGDYYEHPRTSFFVEFPRGPLAIGTDIEEERHAVRGALASDGLNPRRVHRPAPWAALASDDNPVNPIERECLDGPEQRLHAEEPDVRGYSRQVVDAEDVVFVLDAHTHPDVRWPRKSRRQRGEPPRTLRQDLEPMPRFGGHHLEDSPDVALGDLLVEQVGHAVHENEPRLLPHGRQAKGVRNEAKIEALFERMLDDSAKPLGESLRVAVLAAGRDPGAAPHRIPGRVSPLDRAPVAHCSQQDPTGCRPRGCGTSVTNDRSTSSSPRLQPVEVEEYLVGDSGEVIVRRSRVAHLNRFTVKHCQDLPLVHIGKGPKGLEKVPSGFCHAKMIAAGRQVSRRANIAA